MKNLIDMFFKTLALTGAVFKSLLSGYTQVLWALLGIILIKNQDTTILNIPNLEVLNNVLYFISSNWMTITIFISIFYLYCNIKEVNSHTINNASLGGES